MMSKTVVVLFLFLILAVAAYVCYKEGERVGYNDGYNDAIDDIKELFKRELEEDNNDL